MERMTARNIALISPMRPGFAALVKASSFAADIIAKYSGTEMFPFSGDALVYFNALNHQLEEEKKLRDSINYTLHLLVLRRLILEGKAADPTVTKQFLTSVNGNIEQNLHYLRISDNNAYIRAVEAQSYINNSEEFTRNILSSEVYEGAQYYRYSTVDISPLVQRFFGDNSESYAYSGTYFYNEPPAFVYKKEIIEREGSSVPAEGTPAPEQAETAAAAPGSESTEYSYNTENLTYKTENSVNNESTDIHSAENVQNVRNTQDIRNIQNTTDITRTAQDNRSLSGNAVTAAGSAAVQENADVRNIPDIRETRTDGDIRFIQNVQQTSGSSSGGALSDVSAENTEISSESIINAGDTAYNYDSRNFTYRTENYAPEENTGITNVQNTQNVYNSAESIQNNESSIYSPVTEIHEENTGAASETVVNIDGTSYNYDTGNLVYKTENTVNSENSDIRNVQNTQDIRNIVQNVPADRQSQSSGNVQNTPKLSDNVVFPQTANIGGTEGIGIRNAGSELYVRNITDVREISEKLSGQAVQDIRNRQEYGDGQESDAPEAVGSAPVTGTAADSADIIPESVVNVGAASYNYDTENLTYKTENTVNNSDTDIGGSENIRNEQNVLNVTDNTQNVRNITEGAFSASVTNVSVTGASDLHTDILNEPDIPEVHDTVEERNVSGISQTLPDNGASTVFAMMPGITAENDGLASESILNVGDTNYNYDTENLTYKTETAVDNENTGILNIQRNEELRNTQNIRNISETQEIRNISQLTENSVFTPAADTAEAEKRIAPETVVNVGGTSYNYDTENLTYKTENAVNNENTDILNTLSVTEAGSSVQNIQQTQNSENVLNLSENVVSAPVTNVSAGDTELISGTVLNVGGTNYNYDTENLTYKTENTVNNENTGILNTLSVTEAGSSVQNIQQTQNSENVLNLSENVVSAPVTNVSAGDTELISGTVLNVGGTSYNYDTENLTYKTENTVNNENNDILNTRSVTDTGLSVQNIQQTQNSENVLNLSENVVSAPVTNVSAVDTELISGAVLNVGGTSYNYDTENLTYKTENTVNNENNDILNTRSVTDAGLSVQNIQQTQNSENVLNLSENVVSAPVTNVSAGDTELISGTVLNAGGTSYNYDTENLTYKTENTVNNENNDILNTRSVTDAGLSVQNIQQTQNSENVLNMSENVVSASVTNASAGDTELTSGTVLNVGGTSYNYDTENLTYKTETNVNGGGTDIRNITENTVSAPVTNVSADNTRISSENVVNAGDTSFSYDTQNIIYRTETEVPGTREKTGYEEPAQVRSAENARAAAESAAEAAEAALRKVSDIASVDLLVMNTFLSRGAGYFSNVRNRATHRHITLMPAAMPVRGNTAMGLLNSPVSSLGVLAYAVNLLVSENAPNARERGIYDSAVTQVYAERHTRPDIGTKEMLAAMSAPERTKVLRLVTEKLAEVTAADIDTQPVRNERPASASVESASVPVKERMRDLSAAERHTVSESRAYGAAGISGRIPESGTDNTRIAPVQTTANVQSGISGTDGQNGASGAAGMTGPAGVNGTAGASGTDGMSGTEGAAGTNGLNGSNGINAEPRSITKTELKLLRLLTGDMNGETLRRAGTSAAAGTAASLLYKLYYGLPAASGEGRVPQMTANTDNIVYMPALMNYLTVPDHGMNSVPQALTSHITVGNAGNLTTAQSGEEIARYMSYPQTTFHNTSEVSDYRTDLRNINSIQTQQNTFVSQVHQPAAPGTPAQAVPGTAPAAVPGMISGAPAQGIAGASSPKGITGHAAVYQEIPGGMNGAQTVFRKEHTTHDIVRNVLDRINRYERSMKTAAEHTAASERSRTAPAVPAARNTGSVPGVRAAVTGTSPAAMHGISAAAPGTASTVSPGAATVQSPVYAPDIAYDDTYLNYTFNTAVSEYDLPVTLTPQNAVSESVRLLPVYTLDGMILPGNRGDITAGRSSGLPRASVHNGRSVMTHRHIMTVLNGRSLTARNGSPGVPGRDGADAAADSTPQSMLPLMPESAPLSYREPVPQAAPAPPVPQAAETAPPSAAELVKQFGNLVEGGDAGLTPSFEIGTHGFGEAMAAIEQTAEKVAANSKMIEEIREKQRAIESVTLKSSDIDAISEEMIRKLRSRMRLDRSRFSGL